MTQKLEETWAWTNSSFEFPSSNDHGRNERLSQLRRRWDASITVMLGHDGSEDKVLEGSRSKLSDMWFQRIVFSHSECGRAYHTLVHLEEMFCYLDIILSAVTDNIASDEERQRIHAAVALAVFFHDSVYNAQSSTNEEDSIALYQNFSLRFRSLSKDEHECVVDTEKGTGLERRCEQTEKLDDVVVHFILATKSHTIQASDRKNSALLAFLDADMSVLAKSPKAYDAYAWCIRREYQHVPREVYCEKRAEILEGFLSLGDVFVGTGMKELETKARCNLAREINLLRKGVIPNEV